MPSIRQAADPSKGECPFLQKAGGQVNTALEPERGRTGSVPALETGDRRQRRQEVAPSVFLPVFREQQRDSLFAINTILNHTLDFIT